MSDDAINLISSYLTNRRQCIKIGNTSSTFLDIIKGVPQGSIMGPLLFKIFINDIFFFVKNCDLYNYADDNTLSCVDSSFASVKVTLEAEGNELVDWFTRNQTQANPDKFQGLALGKRAFDRKPTFSIKGAEIECTEDAKLLGVDIDYMLKFNTHIKNVCRRASRQINVLKRIGKYLPIKCTLVIYHAFIMSIFNFCPLVWHYCGKGNTDKLDKLQFRALKFVYQYFTSSYENLLIRADTYSLNVKRIRLIALEVFKIISGAGHHIYLN